MIGVRGLPPGIRIPPIEPLSRAQEACPGKPAARPGMFGGGARAGGNVSHRRRINCRRGFVHRITTEKHAQPRTSARISCQGQTPR